MGQDIPVAVGFRRQALYDGTLPNYAGDLGVGPDPALVAHAREADLILAIGSRLGEAVTQGYTLFDRPAARGAARRSCTCTRTRRRSVGCSGPAWASPPT